MRHSRVRIIMRLLKKPHSIAAHSEMNADAKNPVAMDAVRLTLLRVLFNYDRHPNI